MREILEKIAISEDMKYKAMVERSARGLASGNFHQIFDYNKDKMPFQELAQQLDPREQNRKDLGLIYHQTPGPPSYMTKDKYDANHKIIDKYQVWDEVEKNYPIKGPNVHKKMEESFRQKSKAIPEYINDTVGKDIKRRASELSDSATENIKNKSFVNNVFNKIPMNDNMKSIPKPISTTPSKNINKFNKRLLFGAGVIGLAAAGYGAKKMYDKQNKMASILNKIAFSSNAVNALELGGLGILAKPGIGTLRDPNASEHDKNHAAWETAGLGVLGVHPAYELGHAGLQKAQQVGSTQAANMMSHTSPTIRRMGQGLNNIVNKIKFR